MVGTRRSSSGHRLPPWGVAAGAPSLPRAVHVVEVKKTPTYRGFHLHCRALKGSDGLVARGTQSAVTGVVAYVAKSPACHAYTLTAEERPRAY
mmetsp:Transcript_79299/g.157051  ORF Transcript_79299/g.157051 Transcript_79299/m.157051 type:complete len:93 (+) Transcript_79299:542-820(+)